MAVLSVGLAGVLVAAAQPVCLAEATRVRVKVDVRGELFATTGRDADPVRQPIGVDGRFDFVESPAGAEAADGAVIRTFTDATADITVDGQTAHVVLPDDARRLQVARIGTAAVPAMPNAFLTREELDLLETPFDALLLDGLRPTGAMVAGDTWEVPADIAAGLLAIDTIEVGTIEARLEEVVDWRARVVLTGIIEGAVDGVPTHVVVEGTCTIPAAPDISSDTESLRYRLDGGVAHVAVTLQERRQASHVAPGFDVEARVTVSRVAHDGAADGAARIAGDDGAAADAPSPPRRRGTGQPGLLWHRDARGHYDIVYDRRWRIVEQGTAAVVMRYVDLGALVAQCSITALPPAAASSLPTIAEVQRDIRRSLEGQFERFEGATEAARSDGVTIIRVVSAGTAEKLPFRWIHYVLADAAGRRASVTFMMEASMAKRLGDADRTLVDGLALGLDGATVPATAATDGGEQAAPTGGPANREARAPRKTATP